MLQAACLAMGHSYILLDIMGVDIMGLDILGRTLPRSRTNPSTDRFQCHAQILKVICTGVGWIWLVRLLPEYIPVHRRRKQTKV